MRKSTFLAIYFVFWKNQLLRGIHYFKYNHINEKLLTRAFIWCMIHMPEALSWVCLCRVVRRLWYVCLDMRLYTALRGRRAKSTQFRGNFQILFCHNFWTRLLRPMYHTSNESPCQELFNDMIGFGIVYPPQKLVFWKNKIKCWFSQIATLNDLKNMFHNKTLFYENGCIFNELIHRNTQNIWINSHKYIKFIN